MDQNSTGTNCSYSPEKESNKMSSSVGSSTNSHVTELMLAMIEMQVNITGKKQQLATICLSEDAPDVKINKITDLILQWNIDSGVANRNDIFDPSLDQKLKQTLSGEPRTMMEIMNLTETILSPCKELGIILDEIRKVILSPLPDDKKINKIKLTLI
jgi:hypothetical protein